MAIFKFSGGQKTALSSKQVKSYIMKVNGWTADEYRKNYDLFKNKLRAVESFEQAHGVRRAPQSPVELLYKQAKAKQSLGPNYEPSPFMKRIMSASAVSITKGRKLAQGDPMSAYNRAMSKRYGEAVDEAFAGLINKNRIAAEISARIIDPVKREQALKVLAGKIHAKIDRQGKYAEGDACVFGEVIGSPDIYVPDFRIEDYL